MRRVKLFLPLALFAALGVLLFRGLSLDPQALPSALLGDPLPDFRLEELHTRVPMTPQDVVGEPALLNVWATWCYACRVEHPYLLELAAQGVRIIGLNYKDESDKALEWLENLGDPYTLTLADVDGTLGLDLGVYGAPETYVIDANGVVRYRHVGVVDERVWQNTLAPYFAAAAGDQP